MQPGHMIAVPTQMVRIPGAHSHNARRQGKHACAVKTLGILQIVMAGIAVVLGGINVPLSWYGNYACPVWSGILFYLPAGILCFLVAALSTTLRQCLLIACLVMSILSACFAGLNIAFSAANIYYDFHGSPYEAITVTISCVLTLAALAEIVFAVLASVYCCFILAEEHSNNHPYIRYMAVPSHPTMYNHAVPVHGYTTTNANTVLVNQPPTPGTFTVTQSAPPSYTTNVALKNEEKRDVTAGRIITTIENK